MLWFVLLYKAGQKYGEIIVSDHKRRERLRFRSWHRGLCEMDLLMGSFADANLSDFNDTQLDAYEAILECADLDVFNWIIGKVPVPETFCNDVTQKLMAHHFAHKQAH